MKTIKVKYWSDRSYNFTGIAIDQDGNKAYYQNDQYHRTDGGPAVEHANGNKEYWQNGNLHRIDGPAIECTDGYKERYILGQQLTEKQFNLFQKLWEQTDVDKTEKVMMAYTKLVTMGE